MLHGLDHRNQRGVFDDADFRGHVKGPTFGFAKNGVPATEDYRATELGACGASDASGRGFVAFISSGLQRGGIQFGFGGLARKMEMTAENLFDGFNTDQSN